MIDITSIMCVMKPYGHNKDKQQKDTENINKLQLNNKLEYATTNINNDGPATRY